MKTPAFPARRFPGSDPKPGFDRAHQGENRKKQSESDEIERISHGFIRSKKNPESGFGLRVFERLCLSSSGFCPNGLGIRFACEFIADVNGEVHAAIRVAPFVVVPGNDFEKA